MSREATGELAAAWRRLSAADVADLLNRHVSSGWFVRNGKRIEGPCPLGVGKCRGGLKSAYVYFDAKGWSPVIRCGHRGSCGFQATLFELAEARLGKRGAVEEVMRVACLKARLA